MSVNKIVISDEIDKSSIPVIPQSDSKFVAKNMDVVWIENKSKNLLWIKIENFEGELS